MVTYRNLFSSKLLETLIVTVACFLFTYFYYDFFYVEYEALFDSFYSGKLTENMPFRSIYFLGNIGTSHLYSLLYQLNSNIEWISFIFYSYLFVSCFLGLYIVNRILPKSTSIWVCIAIQMFIYLLVFADQNIHFIFTRVSYMVTGISLIALLYFFQDFGSIKRQPFFFVFLNIWFIIGTLTRSESATAVLLLISLFGVFYLQNFKRLVLLFLFPTLFLFSILFAIAYDLKTTPDFYKQVEPEIEAQFCERNNMIPLSDIKTAKDSAMYNAAKNILWIDPLLLTPTYMRSLILPEKFIYTDTRQWERVFRDLSEIIVRFWHLGILCCILGVGLLAFNNKKSVIGFILWLAFVSSFWVLIALQTYTVKVNDRSFSPFISLFIFCHFVILLPYLEEQLRVKTFLISSVILFLFLVHLHSLKKESNQLESDLINYRRNLKTITEVAYGKYLVVNSSSCDYLFSSNKPFHEFDFSAFKKIYITDGFNIPFLPYYRRYLEKECNCKITEFPSFWNYLKENHEKVVVVSSTERMDILTDYLKMVHEYSLPISESTNNRLLQLQKSDARGLFADLKIYYLGR